VKATALRLCALAVLATLPDPGPSVGATEILQGVAFAGCAEVREGPRCLLAEERALTLWFEEDGPVLLAADGEALPALSDRVAGGRRLAVRVPADAERLEVRVEGEAATRVWSIALGAAPVFAALDEAEALRRAGRSEDAAAALDRVAAAQPALRPHVLSRRARLALASGDGDAASRLLDGAAAAHRRAGHRSEAARDAIARVYVEGELRQDLGAAEAALAAAEADVAESPEHRTDLAYQRGVVALATARPGAALAAFERAASWAERLGMQDARLLADQMRATLLTSLGRGREAEPLLDTLLRRSAASELGPCIRGHLLAGRAWSTFLRGEVEPLPPAALDGAQRDAEAALTIAQDTCARASSAADRAVTVALLAVARGRPAEAEAALSEARAALEQRPFRLESWALDAEARAAWARGDRERARAGFARLRRRADDLLHREASWRASWGLARMAEAAEPRLEALEAAEAVLDQEVAEVPLGEGRDTLASRRRQTARALVDTLLRRGDAAAAMAAARRARSRAVRALDRGQRLETIPPEGRDDWWRALTRYHEARRAIDRRLEARWTVASTELEAFDSEVRARLEAAQGDLDRAFRALGRPARWALTAPPPDTVLWLAQPLPEGWALFASHRGRVRAVLREGPPPRVPEALAAWAFGPFRGVLRSASRLSLMAPPVLLDRDLHALPFEGAPLLERLEVVYPLDLAPRGGMRDGPVLVVADPTDDLAGAREELRLLAAAFEGRPRTTLVGRQADRAAVLEALEEASLLHYAGHGVAEGDSGWQHALRLAGGTALTPADILAGPRVPDTVVLSACETARTTAGATDVQGLGVATAFALAGSRVVLAARRPIPDGTAAALAGHLAEEVRGGRDLDITALRRALLALRDEGHEAWSAYQIATATLERP
jgi:tetratricopeptide (TPR) repeat protein